MPVAQKHGLRADIVQQKIHYSPSELPGEKSADKKYRQQDASLTLVYFAAEIS